MGAIVWDGQVSDVSIFPAQFQKSLTAKSRKPETVNFDGPPAALLDFFAGRAHPVAARRPRNGRLCSARSTAQFTLGR